MGIVINHSENIFLPQMIITKPEMEEKVEAFVKNGGTVIVNAAWYPSWYCDDMEK